MENNSKRNKIKIIIISIISILLLLIISNGVKSADDFTIYHSIRSFDKTNDLAYEAVTEPEKFIEYTPGQLFLMNVRNKGTGYAYMGNGGLPYKRTICIYHNQPNTTGNANIKTGNIIDIEAPGKVVVYKFEGLSKSSGTEGTITQSGDVVTEIVTILMNNTEGKYVEHTYAVKYTKKELNLTATQMDDFEAAAYLASRPLGSSNTSNQITTPEMGMDWYWKEKLKNHVKNQGVLDRHFNVNATGNDSAEHDETNEALALMNTAQTVAQNLTAETANLEKVTTTPHIYYVGDKAYIGPLQVKYTGGKTSLIVEGKSGDIIAKWATKKTGNEIAFNSEQSGNVTANQQFYAVVNKSEIGGLSSAKVKLTLTSTGGTSYKSRILLSYSELGRMQHLMHFAGIENTKQTTDEETWIANLNEVSVTIEKKDLAGTTGLPGVQFVLYDANRTKIADLVTNEQGIISKKGLEVNKTYILKETRNTNYGYGNVSIANATIIGGTITKTDKTNREITFTLTTNGTITIKNTPELGKLKIKKIDSETGVGLKNVKFILWKSNTGYIQLYNKSNSQFIQEIQTNSEINITNYTVKYITSITETNKPTKFVTNSTGEITISNLEIYASIFKNEYYNEKYAYLPIEDENPNYGYANSSIDESSVSIQNGEFMNFDGTNSYIRDSDKAIKVLLSSNTTQTTILTVKNKRELGKLQIEKEDSETGAGLKDVKFILWQIGTSYAPKGYIQLYNKSTSQFIPEIDSNTEIDITAYTVKYISSISGTNKPTKFKTNASGKITISNLEIYWKEGAKYTYLLIEDENPNYGYNRVIVDESTVDIENGEFMKFDGTNSYIRESDKAIKFLLSEEPTKITVITVGNGQEVAALLEIIKLGGNGKTTLANVKFKIEIGSGTYLQLQNSNGAVESVTGTVTINKNNIAQGTEYSVEYVTDKELATEFVTDENGKIIINNLEVNASRTQKYTYTAHEIFNPNFGYGSNANVSLKGTIKELKLNEPNEIKITNTQDLGNIKLTKYDEDNQNIVLENVGFIVEVSFQDAASYVALYDKNGNAVESIKATATINKDNKATDTEYNLGYVSNKEDATIFVTGENGVIVINNLEVYAPNKEKYSYKFIEVTNSNRGYVAESQELGNITLESATTTEKVLGNKQKYIDLSGYVWIENPQGKSNGYNNVYTNNNESGDKKLTDLYTKAKGNLVWNENAEIPVKIQLKDKQGNVIKMQPDVFATDGKYTFEQIEIEKISEYQVVFVYDGFYYSTVVPNLEGDKAITSKVKEVQSERENLNSKFGTIEEGKVVSITGAENTVTYTKEGNTATVDSISINTLVSANTSEAEMNFADELDKIKKSPNTEPVEGIQNINMGLIVRERPDLSIFNDIDKVLVNINGYEYSYVYATRNLYTEKQEDQLGVKFENEAYLNQRYTRTIYASDIQAAKQDPNMEFSVSVVYKTTIVNESKTLAIAPKEIANYFDSNYEIKSVTSKADGEQGDEKVNASGIIISDYETEDPNVKDKYKVATIPYTGILAAGAQDEIYITFNIDSFNTNRSEALEKLLKGESTYYNAVEINKYTSYYTQETGKDQGKAYTTDIYQGENQQLYAGIDEDSAPGNIELKLIDHPSGGTQILDTSGYEDDEDAAPSLILVPGEERTISGIVWEDTDLDTTDKERLGDGKYDSSTEKLMGNVVLELMDVETGERAKYSNGNEAIVTTNDRGEYTFGGSTDGEGILPGTYFIRYTYNNETYIVGGKNINALDYKSTIITSSVIESALTDITKDITYGGTNYSGNKWYLIDEGDRYSDAVDDMDLRKAMSTDSVTYETYKDAFKQTMEANTAIMEIGLEYTIKNEAEVGENGTGTTIILTNNLEKVDFGIIERPRINYIIDKDITSLEIVSQTGASIIPKGDPSNPREIIQGVKSGLEGLVEGEIDENLLQGATLKLEYTITVKNTSETDYTDDSYYYYGRGGQTVATVKIKKVVDYLDATVKLDPNQEQAHKDDGWLNDDGTEKTYTHTELAQSGLISGDVQSELEKGNCKIFVNEKFADIAVGEEKTARLYISKLLGVSDEINIYNDVEIIELSGGRTITSSIPGNYVPKHDGGLNGTPHENDDDRVRLTITGPTGATINYTAYIIAIAVMFVILTGGIIIIRRTMKKY